MRISRLAIVTAIAAGCGGNRATDDPPPASGGDDADRAALVVAPAVHVNNGRLATASACVDCHSSSADADAMRDSAGREIAPYDLWQSTMMANSARDPFWRAMVSAEIAANPTRRREITDKCMRCHSPAASVEAGTFGTALTLGALSDESEIGALARDGVTCTVCHQIEADGLGEMGSFSGGFELGNGGAIYGPHSNSFVMPMENNAGFTPTYGAHVRKSELCASCHTLYTTPFDGAGNILEAIYPEQTPYLEWQNSVYARGAETATCQSCHAPITDVGGEKILTAIARNPGGFDFPPVDARSPFGRHIFVGGNTWIPQLLRDYSGSVFNTLATPAAFDATIAAARDQLSSRTARIRISSPERVAGQVSFTVTIENLAGHKFPTGFPSRRAWLEVEVRDDEGTLLAAVGTSDERGRLLGAGGDVLPSESRGGPVLPHRDRVSNPEEVYVLETVMADVAGEPTFELVRAAANYKDNRLLPRGWDDGHPNASAVAPVGVDGDTSFAAGGDTVRVELEVPGQGAANVRVRLLYQPISARFLAELAGRATPEVKAFLAMLETLSLRGEIVAEASVTVEWD